MDVNHINHEIDLKLNLLAGDELCTGDISITPLTLREIMKDGYSNYSRNLTITSINKTDLTGGSKELDRFTLMDIFLYSGNEELLNAFIDSLCMFLREEKSKLLVSEAGLIFGGRDHQRSIEDCVVVTGENYYDIVQIIKYQNCLIDATETYDNPANEAARRIQEKLKKAKEIVNKAKGSSGEEIDFADIVSAVSTKSNTYNKQNIWDLTVYQLYDEYKRLEAISGYEINIQAMMQGAKIKDIKHWSSKI